MNGQVNYIVHASLLLLFSAVSILFFKNLPSSLVNSNQGAFCGTEDVTTSIVLSKKAQEGKTLFMTKCASCHTLFKDMTGPALAGFQNRGPWADKQKIYEWIKNPSAFMQKDKYTRNLRNAYGVVMPAFSLLTKEEIDAICEYTSPSGH